MKITLKHIGNAKDHNILNLTFIYHIDYETNCSKIINLKSHTHISDLFLQHFRVLSSYLFYQ